MEVKSQLYRALDREYLTIDKFNERTGLTDEIGRMLWSLMIYLSKTDFRGRKFKARER